MRKLIDLSQPIENKGHARPFHPTPVVWTHLSHDESAPIWKKGGFSAMVKGVIVSDHSGSHTDAYTHMDTRPSAESIDQLPLHLFFTEAVCIDCSHVPPRTFIDRKSTRLNSSHTVISYAVFCLKKKKQTKSSDSYPQSLHDI